MGPHPNSSFFITRNPPLVWVTGPPNLTLPPPLWLISMPYVSSPCLGSHRGLWIWVVGQTSPAPQGPRPSTCSTPARICPGLLCLLGAAGFCPSGACEQLGWGHRRGSPVGLTSPNSHGSHSVPRDVWEPTYGPLSPPACPSTLWGPQDGWVLGGN